MAGWITNGPDSWVNLGDDKLKNITHIRPQQGVPGQPNPRHLLLLYFANGQSVQMAKSSELVQKLLAYLERQLPEVLAWLDPPKPVEPAQVQQVSSTQKQSGKVPAV